MAKKCKEKCIRTNEFIKEHLLSKGVDPHTCCCVCPALKICKSLNDGLGCEDALDGTYNDNSCVNCSYLVEK